MPLPTAEIDWPATVTTLLSSDVNTSPELASSGAVRWPSLVTPNTWTYAVWNSCVSLWLICAVTVMLSSALMLDGTPPRVMDSTAVATSAVTDTLVLLTLTLTLPSRPDRTLFRSITTVPGLMPTREVDDADMNRATPVFELRRSDATRGVTSTVTDRVVDTRNDACTLTIPLWYRCLQLLLASNQLSTALRVPSLMLHTSG